MFEEIDKRFNVIVEKFSISQNPTFLITKAYEFAKKMHGSQLRKGGDLYLSHPVEVALILADLGFDENVVSAALLHDVVEDCDCDIDTISNLFNSTVAQLVDCVSAIDDKKFVFNKDNIFENENFQKASIEEQSFNKLVSIGKGNVLGFCIKFADRLHNLRTIDCFEYNKQLEKVKETERWIIPIAKAMNAEYFYKAICNECFKIKHRYSGESFFEQYNNYHNSNFENINVLNLHFQELFANTYIKDIKIKNIREYNVYEQVCNLIKTTNIAKISQGQILKVANYNIYLLFKTNKEYKDIVCEIFDVLNSDKELTVTVIDARIDEFTHKPYFELQDKCKNKYRLFIMSLSDYAIQKNGTLDGQNDDWIDDNLDSTDNELIKVKTRSGDIIYIPKGSTVLDFAFKIHRDVGFGFKYAIINNSKTKVPPYTKVFDGDKVEIIVDKDADGVVLNNAKLKWLAYTNSGLAKKYLIKYFESVLGTLG